MALEPIAQSLEALRRRLAAAVPGGGTSNGAPRGDALETLQAFQTAVEELLVAQEEIRGQNEELILARHDLEAERQRYRDLFEFAPDPYLVTDRGGTIQEANRAAGELLNTPPKTLSGKPLVLFVEPDDRLAFQARLARLGQEPTAEAWELRLRPREQSTLTAAVTAAAVRDGRGASTSLRWMVRDVTARKQEERLAALGQMSAGLAHEGRNALQRAQACLERLAWKLQDRPEALDLLRRLELAQNDLIRLFEDVREYAGPLRLDLKACDLAAVWREAWERVQPLRDGRDARLVEEADVDRTCRADARRLSQVFRNVFENALAACADPVRITVACAEAALNGAPALRVAVRDNGPGLGDEPRRKIFEPFFTTKSQGMGLGMAIARQIVETHAGRISVDDGPAPGAEILITLPRRQP